MDATRGDSDRDQRDQTSRRDNRSAAQRSAERSAERRAQRGVQRGAIEVRGIFSGVRGIPRFPLKISPRKILVPVVAQLSSTLRRLRRSAAIVILYY